MKQILQSLSDGTTQLGFMISREQLKQEIDSVDDSQIVDQTRIASGELE